MAAAAKRQPHEAAQRDAQRNRNARAIIKLRYQIIARVAAKQSSPHIAIGESARRMASA